MTQIFKYNKPFILESGATLPAIHLAYTQLGTLTNRNNIVWVFHALTSDSNPTTWWRGLVGDNCLFNPQEHCIICVNVPSSPYGSIHPLDINPTTNQTYYHQFPTFTTRDMIRSFQLLAQHLDITNIHVGIGGSLGGQQLLEWAIEAPNLFQHIIPIATNAKHSAWGIAFNASQRMCIENDSTWQNNDDNAGKKGMGVARALALLSYRNYNTYATTQEGSREADTKPITSQLLNAESYQRYQAEKLESRFNAYSYYLLSKSMDCHNVGRARGLVEDALKRIQAKTLVIGVDSDILFPIEEQKFIAQHVPYAQFSCINSLYGHDGFLLEIEQLKNCIAPFLQPR